ncbi:cell division protein FtsQ/DivIB [Polycladidibacter stylochi]|uniref:cell division protein FtsQ/DivIB n=1 Tax=Polycladidibacter stylochi TaxID=1807766 RepID=UPI000A8EBAE4|nr:cell division protein FtsQ/DivIB [Pseudovibrio stylochi]
MRKIKAKFKTWLLRRRDWGRLILPRGVSRLHQRPTWGVTGVFAYVPRWAGSVGAVSFLGAAAIYGIVLGGHGRIVAESLTTALGFSINSIEIDGLKQVAEFQVLETLEMGEKPSLVMFDAEAARARIQKLNWVRDASIQKLYPGTLKIDIAEQKPYALWQRGDIVSVINRDGAVITDQVDGRYANLLRVVNHGAQFRASEIMQALADYPELRGRVRAANLRSERRWDLNLENGIVVRLPENGLAHALSELVKMDRQSGLLNRDIVAVDLRLKDRVVVRLSKEAAIRRRAALEKRRKNGHQGAET